MGEALPQPPARSSPFLRAGMQLPLGWGAWGEQELRASSLDAVQTQPEGGRIEE